MAETLRQKQSRFAHMIPILIQFAEARGYEVTLGDCYRDPRCGYGNPRSNHRNRLAIDINLFRNGRYLRSTEAYRFLGEFWESIGGTWGGRFEDGNHFSLEHNGVK